MRILFIHNRYQYRGGEDKAVQLEADLLEERGHEVQIVFFENKVDSRASLFFAISALFNLRSRRIIRNHIRDFKPDVLHVHNLFFKASPSIIKAAKRASVPIILTLHNYRLICCNALLLRDGKVCELCVSKKLPGYGIKYRCYRSSALQSALVTIITGLHKYIGTWRKDVDMYICLSQFAKERFLNSSLDIEEARIKILPNYELDHGFHDYEREDYFLYVGRITHEKGISVALECFSHLQEEKLLIVGDGPLFVLLKGQYQNCSNIRFLGALDHNKIPELMKKCKALVFPSIWYEGLPFTILEAFATGTPVLASNLGTMASVVKEGYNGFRFRTGDWQDLVRCILQFNAAGIEKDKLCNNARRTYEQEYNAESHYNGLLGIYKECLKLTDE